MKFSKIGFLVPHLGRSQFSFQLTHGVNFAINENPFLDVCIFTENTVQLGFQHHFPLMSIYYAYHYEGSLVATSITTAKKLIGFPSSTRKLFYVWDLEWMAIKDKKYLELADIYQSKNLELVARSDMHAKIIERTWDVPVKDVVEDFHVLDMMKVVDNGKKS